MWWPSRRAGGLLLLALTLAAAAGCGFQPLYGPGQETRLARVAVERIPERDGQILRNALLQRLDPRGEPHWRLSVELAEARSNLVSGDGDTQRVRLRFEASYRLAPSGPDRQGRPALTGTEDVTTSFNEPDPVLATEAAERAAKRNALDALAQRLVDALARRLQDGGPGEDSAS